VATDDIVRVATPRRAIPNEDPEVGRLSAMVMALLGELAITRERLDTVERLLEAANVLRQSDVEAYEPTGQASGEREQLRKRCAHSRSTSKKPSRTSSRRSPMRTPYSKRRSRNEPSDDARGHA
jgi:hypothetical protein